MADNRQIKTRTQAYIVLFNPTLEELAGTSKIKICESLAEVTSVKASTWSNNDVLLKTHIEAVDYAIVKREHAKMRELLFNLIHSDEPMISHFKEIAEFLSREES